MDINNTLSLYKAAHYYYIEHLSQQEIASKMNISRPQISRMLKKAQETGIVKIQVNFPNFLSAEQISTKIENYFQHTCRIILTPFSEEAQKNDEALYINAAKHLKFFLENAHNIGIGWGQTLYNISLHLSNHVDSKKRCFIAVSGTSGTCNPYFQTNNIVDRFAASYGANAFYNNFSSLIDTSMLSAFEQKRLHTLQNKWNTLDTLIIGLGSVEKAKEHYSEEFFDTNFFDYVSKEMEGEILGNFFSEQKIYHFEDTRCISSLSLEHLLNIKTTICIAHGSSKVSPLILALKKGYINTLITDYNTGKLILEKLEKET